MSFGRPLPPGEDKRREAVMLLLCLALAIVAIVLLAIGIDTQSQGIGNAMASVSSSFRRSDGSPTPTPTPTPTATPSAIATAQPGRAVARPDPSSPHGPVGVGTADWITSDDYPAIALSHELQGRVRIELSIASTGKVTGCRVVETSYVPLLDETACDAMRRRARFDPARDPDGQPIPSTWQRNIVWTLPS